MLVIATPDAFAARKMIEIARILNPAIDTVVRTHSEEEAELLRQERVGKVFIGEHELALGMTGHVVDRLVRRRARLTVSSELARPPGELALGAADPELRAERSLVRTGPPGRARRRGPARAFERRQRGEQRDAPRDAARLRGIVAEERQPFARRVEPPAAASIRARTDCASAIGALVALPSGRRPSARSAIARAASASPARSRAAAWAASVAAAKSRWPFEIASCSAALELAPHRRAVAAGVGPEAAQGVGTDQAEVAAGLGATQLELGGDRLDPVELSAETAIAPRR